MGVTRLERLNVKFLKLSTWRSDRPIEPLAKV
jgi:hypothetical protein